MAGVRHFCIGQSEEAHGVDAIDGFVVHVMIRVANGRCAVDTINRITARELAAGRVVVSCPEVNEVVKGEFTAVAEFGFERVRPSCLSEWCVGGVTPPCQGDVRPLVLL
jgi:hypothetical protein